jgi:hypothetical protein
MASIAGVSFRGRRGSYDSAERPMPRSPQARRFDTPPWQSIATWSRRDCGLTIFSVHLAHRKLPRQVDSSKPEFRRRAIARDSAPVAGFPARRAA